VSMTATVFIPKLVDWAPEVAVKNPVGASFEGA